MRDNFLEIEVFWGSNDMTVLKEVASVGLENLIGNMGGLLNLWVGITFITLIELIECFLKLLPGHRDYTVQPRTSENELDKKNTVEKNKNNMSPPTEYWQYGVKTST